MEITLLSTKHQRNFSKDNVSESCSVWNCSYGNSTNVTLFEEDEDEELSIYLGAFSWILVVLYIITFMIGLIGNALVCFAVWRNKNMRTVTNVFLVNLAAADLGVIIICLPPALIADVTNTWFLGGPFCNIHLCLSTVSIAVSVLTLCAISVERWYAICHPLQFRSTIQRARFIILAVWFISICIAVPEAASAVVIYQSNDTVIGAYCYPGLMTDKQIQTFQIVLMVVFYFVPLALMGYTYSSIAIVLSKKHIPGITYSAVPEAASAVVIYQSNDTVIGAYCYPGLMTDKQIQTFQIVLMVVFYFVPLALMGYTYSSIAIVLSKKHIPGITYSDKCLRPRESNLNDGADQLEGRRKAARMLVMVVCLFAICFLPIHGLNIIRYTVGLKVVPHVEIIALLAHWTMYFNSCVNPIIYNFFSGKFRKEFRLAVKICVGCGMSESVRQSEMLRMTLYSGRSMIYRYNSNRRSQACRTEEAAMETVHLQDKNISVY